MVKLLMLIISLAGGGAQRVVLNLNLNLAPNVKRRIVTLTNEISKRKYVFINLSVLKENNRAINLFQKFEYEVFYEKEEFYYMIHSYRFVGKIIERARE